MWWGEDACADDERNCRTPLRNGQRNIYHRDRSIDSRQRGEERIGGQQNHFMRPTAWEGKEVTKHEDGLFGFMLRTGINGSIMRRKATDGGTSRNAEGTVNILRWRREGTYCITLYFRGRKFSRKVNFKYFHAKISSRENIFPRK